MHILVIGGAGPLASRLVEALARAERRAHVASPPALALAERS